MEELDFTLDLVKDCGKLILKNFKGIFEVDYKTANNNLVTSVDKEIDRFIRERIKKFYPTYGIITEEGEDVSADAKKVFVVDPLDGTTNFVKGYPFVAVSIALLQDGKVVMGVVYNPILEELFYAVLGSGAFKGGMPIHVSSTTRLQNALLSTGFPYDFSEYSNFPQFEMFFRRSISVRVDGSAALDLAHVAEGVIDGYWERGLNIWDIAAATLLVEEANGVVSDFSGKRDFLKKGEVVASNSVLHKEMLEVLNAF